MKRPAPSRGLAAAVLRALFRSPPLQVVATSIIYAFYGCLIGVALLPSALLELRAYHTLFDGPSAPSSISSTVRWRRISGSC